MKLEVENQKDNSRLSFGKSFFRTILKLIPWELIHLGINLPVPVMFAEEPSFRLVSQIGVTLFVLYFLSLVVSRQGQTVYDGVLGVVVSTGR
jgi:hypothetical protein